MILLSSYFLQRSTSVSMLAPSLALPQYYRQAERIVHTERVYKPFMYDWYNNAYSQHRYIDTQREIMRPLKRDPAPGRYKQLKYESGLAPRSSWIPYYSNQTKRIYNDEVNDGYSVFVGFDHLKRVEMTFTLSHSHRIENHFLQKHIIQFYNYTFLTESIANALIFTWFATIS